MTAYPRFHLAIPVKDSDFADTRAFYGQLLGCPEGRSSEKWVDFDFWGHQLVAHLAPEEVAPAQRNKVDGDDVPARHFGAILAWDAWHAMAEKLKKAGVAFIIEPHVRFRGHIGEQATMFFLDPSGNALEFKSFRDESKLFAI
jgi:extradiol dioxygenase family protein